MSDYIGRARKALKRIHQKNVEDDFVYGTVGRLVDGVPTFAVTGRTNFVQVTIRQANGAQTTVPARNDAGVPKALGLPVRMYKQGTTYVIDSIAKRSDLAYMSPGQDPDIHTHDNRYYTEAEHIATSAGAADAGKPVKLDENGTFDPSLFIDTAPEQTVVEDANRFPLSDDGVLKWLSWANIKVALNSLYARLAAANTFVQNITIASTATTGSALRIVRNLASGSTDSPVVDIVQDHATDDQSALRVQQDGTGAIAELLDGSAVVLRVNDGGQMDVAQIVRALTSAGLQLQDDSGIVAVTVADGGNVGIGPDATTPSFPLVVQKNFNGATLLLAFNTTDGTAAQAAGGVSRTNPPSNDYLTWGITAPSYTGGGGGYGHVAYFHSNGAPFKLGTLDTEDFYLFVNGIANPKLGIKGATGIIGLLNAATSPQGHLHLHDGTFGWMLVRKANVNATPQTIHSDTTGDIVRGALVEYVAWDGTNFAAAGNISIANGGTHGIVMGTSTYTITVNANGSMTIARSSGTGTLTSIALKILWL